MMKPHDHVVLGSLLHDIGKFWERAGMLGRDRASSDERQLHCPWHPEGYFSHLHVLNTREFCESLANRWPIAPSPGSDQNWINLASRHHKTSTALEVLVAEADHLASAEREKGDFYTRDIHRKTRLEALLGRVTLSQDERSNDYRLPVAALSLEKDAIYPRPAQSFTPPMRRVDQGWLSDTSLESEYKALGAGFQCAIDALPQYAAATPEALDSMVRSLLSAMERYLCNVPAATNIIHPDISLYDHLRVTAAIAEGLFLYHQSQGNLEDVSAIRDRKTAKWRLVCGDFSGIQSFIYKLTSKGAAKALRGRSFYIQLLCDGVSDHLLRKLGLYASSRIYSSGGKFFLLIPAHLERALRAEVDTVNQSLLKEFQGDVFLGLGVTAVCGDDFQGGNMGVKWKQVSESLQQDRLQAFRQSIAEDPEAFFHPQALNASHCAVCSRDDKDARITLREGRATCRQCEQLERLGQALRNTRFLFWVYGAGRFSTRQELELQAETRIELPGTEFDLYLLEKPPALSELRRMENAHLEAINHFENPINNPNGYACGFRFAGKWDQAKESHDWEFDDFASEAVGVARLGILRMDVDNLGEVFVRGLSFKDAGTSNREKPLGSLSRIATLSRQLHLFFAGYLNTLLEKFHHSQIIYAGGDDVFLLGSWNELPQVAATIRTEFRRYCADNEHFTLSGGIAMVDGRYPISKAAQLAGDAEHEAKNLRRGEGNSKEKDALTFLDTSIGWEDFPRAEKLMQEICAITEETHSRALLGRLRSVIESVGEFQRLSELQHKTPEQIQSLIHWQKWRWRLVYNLERMARRDPAMEDRLNKIRQQIVDPDLTAGQPVLDWLQLPTRWAEFLTRR